MILGAEINLVVIVMWTIMSSCKKNSILQNVNCGGVYFSVNHTLSLLSITDNYICLHPNVLKDFQDIVTVLGVVYPGMYAMGVGK